MNIIRFNQAKQGIEISFPGKPSEEIRSSLKTDGFRWGKFNKVWYIKDSEAARQKAAKYGTLPPAPAFLQYEDWLDNHNADQAARNIGLI